MPKRCLIVERERHESKPERAGVSSEYLEPTVGCLRRPSGARSDVCG